MLGTPIDEGSQHDKNSIELSTKQRTWIYNVRRPERSPLSMQEAEKFAHKNCPNIKTRSLSSTYNCVGMIFASRRTAIDPDQLPKIFNDDEYVRVLNRSELMVGDLVAYKKSPIAKDVDHIGLIIKIDFQISPPDVKILVLSQWGFDGEYI